jgi:hypothetical protein
MKQVLLALVVSILIPLGARADTSWKGTSTNMSGNFNYGPVTFTVRGNKIRNFKIEGVTTSGCGGYKNVVVPSIKIRGKKFSAVYIPIPGIDDKIRVKGSFNGNKATGTFSEGPLCSNAGKFKATRR